MRRTAAQGKAANRLTAGKFLLDASDPVAYPGRASGDVLQGAAADCNSAGETHAWFDSRVAHHFPQDQCLKGCFARCGAILRKNRCLVSSVAQM
jgi:hypothetical protein